MMPSMLQRLFGSRLATELAPARRELFAAKRPELLVDAAAIERRAIFDAARDLPDDTPCDDRLLAAITGEARARRAATGTLAGPALPKFSDLRVRRAGLPDWWEQGGNLALAAPGSGPQEWSLDFMPIVPTNVVAVFGARTTFNLARFIGDGGLLLLGDDVTLIASAIVIGANTTVMFGEGATATWMCNIDARNGGMVAVGADSMFAAGISVLSDDTHAIRDAVTNARINRFGGRVIVDRHVWIGDQARLMGDCSIGPDAIVGAGSFVKNVALPGQAVSVGRPARPVRTGVTWNRIDEP